jgi:hypothetical protein
MEHPFVQARTLKIIGRNQSVPTVRSQRSYHQREEYKVGIFRHFCPFVLSTLAFKACQSQQKSWIIEAKTVPQSKNCLQGAHHRRSSKRSSRRNSSRHRSNAGRKATKGHEGRPTLHQIKLLPVRGTE